MTRDILRSDATLTREEIRSVINHKLENAIYWLNKAYDARPQDWAAEKTLLELMAVLQKLKRESHEALQHKAHAGRPIRQQPTPGSFKNMIS